MYSIHFMTDLNVELVNSGGFSNVYKVVNYESKTKIKLASSSASSLPRNVCIKVSSIDKGTCEYELMRSLDHDNIIKTYFGYYDVTSGMYVLGMPYIDNGDLESTKSPLNYLHLIKQVLAGLEHLHSHGIVHCDIKPSNILVTSSPSRYIIIDLNIANVYRQGGMHRRFRCNLNAPIIGTKQYASLFALLRCLPFCRDDIESFFLVCLYLKFMRMDPIFVDSTTSLATLREMRIDMQTKYKCIQYLRSMPFYASLDYKLIYDLMIDEFVDI